MNDLIRNNVCPIELNVRQSTKPSIEIVKNEKLIDATESQTQAEEESH